MRPPLDAISRPAGDHAGQPLPRRAGNLLATLREMPNLGPHCSEIVYVHSAGTITIPGPFACSSPPCVPSRQPRTGDRP